MTDYNFTTEDITRLRDDDQLSWAKVAEALDLGSPGAARRAYTALVRPHTDSVLVGRTRSGAAQPVDLADATLAQVQEGITGRTVTVTRKNGTEDITVVKVTSVKNGNVNFSDGNKSRTVKAAAIVAVK